MEVTIKVTCKDARSFRVVQKDMEMYMDARCVPVGDTTFTATVSCADGDKDGLPRHIERTYGESVYDVRIIDS